MANYDPNDPDKTTPRETYVEPVEKRSSPLPLIIGILLALVGSTLMVYSDEKRGAAPTPTAAAFESTQLRSHT